MSLRVLDQISPKLKILLSAVLLIVAVQYGLFPFVEWQRETVDRVVSLQETIARKKALIGNEAMIREVHAQSVSALEKWQARIRPGPAEARALKLDLQRKVEGEAKRIGASISNVTWLPPVEREIVRAPIRFRIDSKPEDFMKLLSALESGPWFVSVDGIRITGGRGSSETFTAEIDVSAYATAGGGAAK